jgi:hypothetical protein
MQDITPDFVWQSLLELEPPITQREVHQCLYNRRAGCYLFDARWVGANLQPTPVWFIAPTHRLRMLKVVVAMTADTLRVHAACDPTPQDFALFAHFFPNED